MKAAALRGIAVSVCLCVQDSTSKCTYSNTEFHCGVWNMSDTIGVYFENLLGM